MSGHEFEPTLEPGGLEAEAILKEEIDRTAVAAEEERLARISRVLGTDNPRPIRIGAVTLFFDKTGIHLVDVLGENNAA